MPTKPIARKQRQTVQPIPCAPFVALELGETGSVEEIQRLAAAAIREGTGEQSAALVELLTHIIPHDKSGWSMFARNAVIRADSELLDEAADLIAAKLQRERREGRSHD